MHIAIIDPALDKVGGHCLDLDLRLAATLRQHGHGVIVAGHENMAEPAKEALRAEGIATLAIFSMNIYERPTAGQDPCRMILAAAEAFQHDLGRLPGADLWLFSTLTTPQLVACAKGPAMPRLAGIVHSSPSGMNICGGELWATACRALKERGSPVALGACEGEIAANYLSLSGGLAVHRFPIPYDGAGRAALPAAPRRIGFFGNQRPEKGAVAIPDLVAALIGRGFEVLVQDSDGTLPPLPPHPRLSLLRHVRDFAATMATCDLVVWPSLGQHYRGRGSGVVWEAVASGLPLVMPSDCLPANRVAEIGSGAFFHQFSLASIMRAVDEAIARYPELALAAQRGAQAWKSREGTEAFVTRLTNGSLWP
jgi:hypothetical protein